MLKIFNKKHEQVNIIENPISPVVLDTLNTIGEFSFSLPTKQATSIELEGYVQIEKGQEYVVKEKVKHGQNTEVVCMLNIEEIVGMAYPTFISKDNNVYDTARMILDGTGWRVNNLATDKVSTRNMYGKVTNSYNLLVLMCTVFDVEVAFDTYNKEVTIVDRVGVDRGTYFISDLNLKKVTHDTHTHKYITRVIPVGKDGLTIESVNGGKNYLTNNQYTNKVIYGIWQSDKHDNPQKLKDDAQRFLNEMAVPYETYEVTVEDLYKLRGKDVFKYDVGDVVTIIDSETETRIEQRIIQREKNLLNPTQDTIRIANKAMTFQEYYKRLQVIADMTESVIGTDGTINGDSIGDGSLNGDKLQMDSILAGHIKANQIQAHHIVADSITADKILANSIDTKHLKADIIQAEHIQAGAITAGSGVIADGAIGNAQIANLDAGKINAGKINTSLVQVQSESGNLDISDNTIQIRDDKGQARVQIGKDARDDYNMYVFDEQGSVMFDATGVTASGIKTPIIRDDMISDTAHINGAKINIDSVITEINDNGTTDLKTSKLVFDDTGQKFDVEFTNVKTTVEETKETTDYNTTQINMQQGKIETLIKDTTIIKEDGEYKLKDEFSKLEQTTGGIVANVESNYMSTTANLIPNSNFIANPKHQLWGFWSQGGSANWYLHQHLGFPEGEGLGIRCGRSTNCTATSPNTPVVAGEYYTVSMDLLVERNVDYAIVEVREINKDGAFVHSHEFRYERNFEGRLTETFRVVNPNAKSVQIIIWHKGAIVDDGRYVVVFFNRVQLQRGKSVATWRPSDANENSVSLAKLQIESDNIKTTVQKIEGDYVTGTQWTQTNEEFIYQFQNNGKPNELINSDWKKGFDNWGIYADNGAWINHVAEGSFSGCPFTGGIGIGGCSGYNAHSYVVQSVKPNSSSASQFTISAWAYDENIEPIHGDGRYGAMADFYIQIVYQDGHTDYVSAYIPNYLQQRNQWKRISCTFNPNTHDHGRIDRIEVFVYMRNCHGRLYVSQIQLEEGGFMSSWKPSDKQLYNNITTIDGQGVKVNHSNGDYTLQSADGMKRYRGSGDAKGDYHYLTQYIGFSGKDTVWVQLKDDFKGKNFTAYSVISDTWEGSWDWGQPWVVQRFVTYVEVDKIDYANARVPVLIYRIDKNYQTGDYRKMPCAGVLLVVA